MILIVKENNGESYEDYYEWIVALYKIEDSIDSQSIEKAHKKHLIEKCLEQNIHVNIHYPNILDSNVHSKKKDLKRISPIHQEILKNNGFEKFIAEKYNAKKIENYQEIMKFY